MPLRVAAPLFVIAALVAAPAGADAAQVVRPSSVSGTATLPAGSTQTIGLECPPPSVAVNAAVTSKGSGVTVNRSIPGSGARDWSFRVAVARGGGVRRLRSVLRCVRLRLPPGVARTRLEVKTRGRPGVSIPAGGTVAVNLRCGSAWLATGYGFDAGRSGNVRLASAVPVAHGWNFNLENVGSARATAGVSARCLGQAVTAADDSAELRFRIARPSASNILGTGSAPTFSHSCGASQFSLATGFTLDPLDTIELTVSGPVKNGRGQWTFGQASGGEQVQSFLVCLSRRSGFR